MAYVGTKHKGTIIRNPIVNIAFATDWQEGGIHPVGQPVTAGKGMGAERMGEMTVVFVGADEPMLAALFRYLCAAGIARGFRIEEQRPPQFTQGVVWERLGVTLEGYDGRMASADVLAAVIESWIRRNVRVNLLDRYDIDDLLNLRGHTPELLLNGDRPKKPTQPGPPKEEKKKRGRKKKSEATAGTQGTVPVVTFADAGTSQRGQSPSAAQSDETTIQTNNEEDMANIYLKVPWYVAAHFRGRDEDHQLTEWEPVKFTDFDHEFQIMVNNCRRIPEQNQSPQCWSQRAWNNILRGRKPDGSMLILNRDPGKWPDTNEMATLVGLKMSGRQHASDYLCIEMPREVWFNKRSWRTNSCYSLPYDSAYYMASVLTDKFCYEYTQWVTQDIRNAAALGFKRKQLEAVERYFVQYNYPDIIDPQLRESMRRQHNRFMKKGLSKPKFGLQFGHAFLEHVSEEDQKKIDENKRHK